jgi:hypothetical protein
VPIAVDKQQLIRASGSRERFAAERTVIGKFTGGKTGELAVHLLTPEGESLTSKNIFRQQSSADVLATLRESLAKFGPVTPRRVRPNWQDPARGFGTREDGSVRLALYSRHTDRRDYTIRPVFDNLVLTQADWAALRPKQLATGTRFEIPENIARQFARGLATNSDLSYLLRPQDLTTGRLVGEVIASDGEATRIALSGELQGTRKHVNGGEPMTGQATLTGQLILNGSSQPTKLIVVYEGTFNLPYEKNPRPMAALIEWRSE